LGDKHLITIAKPMIGPEEVQAVLEVLESGILAQGPRVGAFEDTFARICGVEFAIATSSGTSALHVALLAHGIGPGDEVITSPFTFIASANSILFTGARPVFVDIDPRTFNLNPDLIEAAITSRTKAIMPVHLYGLACDMVPILSLADRYGLVVIEDACQSHAAEYRGKRVGSFGTGCFSLYPTKNITSAEGGMITSNNAAFAEKCRLLRQHGMPQRNLHTELGFNFRMTDIHAAIGLAQLGKLGTFNRTRQENARFFSENLEGVVVPTVPKDCLHVFHQYTVRVPAGQREALRAHLTGQGVGSAIYYPRAVHQQPYYRDVLGYDLDLSVAQLAAQEVLSLPVHPALSARELDRIVAAVNQFFETI